MADEAPAILALDTATKCSTVALTRGDVKDGQVLACLSLSSNITHSRRLISCVDLLFQETGLNWDDIGGVAIGLGPGSFTGLRIGMAMAKGFAATAGCDLLGVCTLDGIAAGCITDKQLCVAVDARKKQVYTARYKKTGDQVMERISNVRALSPEDLVHELVEPTIIVGDGVENYGEQWRQLAITEVGIAPSHLHSPNASAIGLIGEEKRAAGQALEIAGATPMYVRSSDAELSLKAKLRD